MAAPLAPTTVGVRGVGDPGQRADPAGGESPQLQCQLLPDRHGYALHNGVQTEQVAKVSEHGERRNPEPPTATR
jgi:hypothetical protein